MFYMSVNAYFCVFKVTQVRMCYSISIHNGLHTHSSFTFSLQANGLIRSGLTNKQCSVLVLLVTNTMRSFEDPTKYIGTVRMVCCSAGITLFWPLVQQTNSFVQLGLWDKQTFHDCMKIASRSVNQFYRQKSKMLRSSLITCTCITTSQWQIPQIYA